MRYTRSAITELTRLYRDVLIKCAMFNAAVFVGVAGLASGAAAEQIQDGDFPITDVSDADAWYEIQSSTKDVYRYNTNDPEDGIGEPSAITIENGAQLTLIGPKYANGGAPFDNQDAYSVLNLIVGNSDGILENVVIENGGTLVLGRLNDDPGHETDWRKANIESDVFTSEGSVVVNPYSSITANTLDLYGQTALSDESVIYGGVKYGTETPAITIGGTGHLNANGGTIYTNSAKVVKVDGSINVNMDSTLKVKNAYMDYTKVPSAGDFEFVRVALSYDGGESYEPMDYYDAGDFLYWEGVDVVFDGSNPVSITVKDGYALKYIDDSSVEQTVTAGQTITDPMDNVAFYNYGIVTTDVNNTLDVTSGATILMGNNALLKANVNGITYEAETPTSVDGTVIFNVLTTEPAIEGDVSVGQIQVYSADANLSDLVSGGVAANELTINGVGNELTVNKPLTMLGNELNPFSINGAGTVKLTGVGGTVNAIEAVGPGEIASKGVSFVIDDNGDDYSLNNFLGENTEISNDVDEISVIGESNNASLIIDKSLNADGSDVTLALSGTGAKIQISADSNVTDVSLSDGGYEGGMTVDADKTLTVSNSFVEQTAGGIVNNGTIAITGGTAEFDTGIDGGNVELSGAAVVALNAGAAINGNVSVTGGAPELNLQNADAQDSMTFDTFNSVGVTELGLSIDYDATGNYMDKITINGGAGKITLKAINVLNDNSSFTPYTLGVYLDGELASIDVISDAIDVATLGGTYTFTPTVNKGELSIVRSGVAADIIEAIQNPDIEVYSMSENFTAEENFGTLAGDGRELTVFGNNNEINANGYEGIIVDAGQELTLDKVASFTGASGAAVSNSGSLTVSDSVITGNGVGDIANGGSLTFTGENTVGTITGTGTTSLEENSVVAADSITQDTVSVAETAALSAETITATGIDNDGSLTLTGVANATNIAGTGVTTIATDGTMNNTALIEQSELVINSGATFVSEAAKLVDVDTITNQGTLKISGTTNENSVKGDGETVIASGSDMTNTGIISQDITVENGATLTSSFNMLEGAITNNGIINAANNDIWTKAVGGNGTVKVNGTLVASNNAAVESGILDLNAGTLDMASDETVKTLNVGSLKGNGNITINIETPSAGVVNNDAINITDGSDNSGTITVSGITAIGDLISFEATVLSGDTAGLTLALSGDLVTEYAEDDTEHKTSDDEITQETSWGTDFYHREWDDHTVAGISAVGNKVVYNKTTTKENIDNTLLGDSLALMNTTGLYSSTHRTFGSDDSAAEHVVSENLGKTAVGVFNVAGVRSEIDPTEASTLNMNNKTGFEIEPSLTELKATLNLTDLNITGVNNSEGGLLNVTAEDATVNVSGVNVAAGADNAIVNNATLNFTGTNEINTGIIGTGVTNVGTNTADNVSTTVSSIEQSQININSGVFTVNGNVTADSIVNAVDGGLVIKNGTLTADVEGEGSIVTKGASVIDEDSSIGQVIAVSDGTLTVEDAESLAADVNNDAEVILLGGELGAGIQGGITTIGNGADAITVTNVDGGSITGGDIVITAAAKLITSADSISDETGVANSGTLELNAGTLTSAVGGTGVTQIDSEDTVGVSSSITQNVNVLNGTLALTDAAVIEGNVDNDATLTLADSAAITGNVDNSATLTLEGGAAITGNVTNSGEFTNNGEGVITGNIVNSGTLTSAANTLVDADGIDNTGTITLTGGTLASAINGAGDTVIDGDVTAGAAIANAITVNVEGSLTANANNIQGAVTNNAENGLVLTTGTLAQNVGGDGSTKIDSEDTVTLTAEIEQDVNVVNGTLAMTGTASVTGDVVNEATLTLAGTSAITGDVDNSGDLTNSGTGVITGNIVNSGTLTSAANTLVDDDGIENSGTINLTGGTLASAINGGTLNINENVDSVADYIAGEINTIASGKTLSLTEGTLAGAVSGDGTLSIDGDVSSVADNIGAAVNTVTTGNTLTLTEGTLAGAVSGAGSVTIAGEVANNGTSAISNAITVNEGAIFSTTVNGFTQNIENNDGTVVLANDGISTSLQHSVAGNTTISGTVVTNNNSLETVTVDEGSVLTATSANDVTGTVTNGGTYNINGGVVQNTVTGGTVNINGAVSSNASYIAGDTNNVTTGNTLTLTGTGDEGILLKAVGGEGGIVVADAAVIQTDADNLQVDDGVSLATADSKLVLTSDETDNVLSTAVTGIGTLEIAGDVASNAANIGAATNTVTEGNTLSLTGGTLAGVISGEGALAIGTEDASAEVTTVAANLQTDAATTLVNNSTLTLTGAGDPSGVLSSAIVGDDSNNAIVIDGTVITAAENLGVDTTINSGKFLTLNGGTLGATVSGEGTLTVAVGEEVSADADYLKTDISVADAASTLNLTSDEAGDNEFTVAVTGNGTTNIVGEITVNGGLIDTDTITVAEGGVLTTAVNGFASDITNNEGEVVLTGAGALMNSIDGNTTIDGSITNNATLVNVTVNEGATFTAVTANKVTGTVDNSGTYNILNGTVQAAVTGGEVYIKGDVSSNASYIGGETNNVFSGNTLTLTGTGDEGTLSNVIEGEGGIAVADAAVIQTDVDNLQVENGVSLTAAGSKLTLTGDETGDDILSTAVTGLGTLEIAGDITSDAANVGATTNTVTSGNTLTLTGGTLAGVVNGEGAIAIDNAAVTTDAGNLKTEEETTLVNNSTLTLTGTSAELQNKIVAGDDSDNSIIVDGSVITVAENIGIDTEIKDAGDVLALLGDAETGIVDVEISGEGTVQIGTGSNAATVQINADNLLAAGGADVKADSTLTLASDGDGDVLSVAIVGGGTTNVAGNVEIDGGSIGTDTITVAENAVLTTGVDGFTSNITDNEGMVILNGDGTLNHSIDGETTIDGTIINNANLGTVTINEGKTLTSSADNVTGTVTNDGTYNITGGTVAAAVTGGTVNINGDVSSDAGYIGGETNTVADTMTLTLTGGELAGAVDGAGSIVIADAANVTSEAANLQTEGGVMLATADSTLVLTGDVFLEDESGILDNHIDIGAGTVQIGTNAESATIQADAAALDATTGQTVLYGNSTLILTGLGTTPSVVGTDISSSGTGTKATVITGKVENTGNKMIETDVIEISDSASTADYFKTNADYIGGTVVTSNGTTLTLTGGTLAQDVMGEGVTEISGAVTVQSGRIIEQDSIENNASGVLTADAASIQSYVHNLGEVHLMGDAGAGTGILDSIISGNGQIYIGKAGEAVATVQTDAWNLSATTTETNVLADNTLILTGNLEDGSGVLANNVIGEGALQIGNGDEEAAVTNVNGDTEFVIDVGSILVNSGATFRTTVNGFSGTLTNKGTVQLVGDGTLPNPATIISEDGGNLSIEGNITANADQLNADTDILSEGTLTLLGTGAVGELSSAITGEGTLFIGNNDEDAVITTNADNIMASTTIVGESELVLNGGTLGANVSGSDDGKVTIDGDVTADSEISTDVLVYAGSNLNMTENAEITGDIINHGTFNVTGINEFEEIAGAGDVNIIGGRTEIVSDGSLEQSNLSIGEGTEGGASFHNFGTVELIGDITVNNGYSTLYNGYSATGGVEITALGDLNNDGMIVNQANAVMNVGGNLVNGVGAVEALDIDGYDTVEEVEAAIAEAEEAKTEGFTTFSNGGTLNVTGTLTNNKSFFNGKDIVADGGIINNGDFVNSTEYGLSSITADFTNNEGATLTTIASGINGTVTNNGTVNLKSVDEDTKVLSFNINGSGTTDIIGVVAAEGEYGIGNNIMIEGEGALIANADNIQGAVTNNVENGLLLTAGTLAQNVSGEGSIQINSLGEVGATSVIEQGVNVLSGTFAMTGTASVTGDVDIANEATLTLANNATVTGDVANVGTLTLSDNTFIEGDVNNVGEGVIVLLNEANISGNVTNGGTITLADEGNASIIGDVDNSGEIINNGTGVINGNITNSGILTSSANTLADTDGTIENDNGTINLTGGVLTSVVSGGSLNIDGDVETVADNIAGEVNTITEGNSLTLRNGTLDAVIDGDGTLNIDENVGTVASNIAVATTVLSGAELTLSGEEDTTGVLAATIGGEGTTTIVGYITNDAETVISTEISVDGNATFSTVADGFTQDIVNNNGTVILNGEGTLVNDVAGNTVIAGTIENSANLEYVTVNEGGTLTSNADNVSGEVTNSGTYNITGGEIAAVVTGGALNINGDVSSVAENIKADTNTITEGNTLSLTGGELTAAIDGEGTLSIEGDVETSADNIGAAANTITEGNVLSLTGGELTAAIDGAGTLSINGYVESDAANIGAAVNTVAADNILVLTGGELAGVVDGDGSVVIGMTEEAATVTAEASKLGTTTATNVVGGSTIILIDDGETSTLDNTIIGEGTIEISGDIQTIVNNIGAATVIDEGNNLFLLNDGEAGDLMQTVSGEGTLNIGVDSVNNANILSNADNIQTASAIVNENSKLTLTGGVLSDEVSLEVAEGGSIAVSGDTSANADSFGSDVSVDAGVLTLTGGTLDAVVNGDGGIAIGTAEVVAEVTTNAANLQTAEDTTVSNGSTLTLTGEGDTGVLTNALIGEGNLVVDGAIVNENGNEVQLDATINEGKSLTSNADDIGGAVANNGTYTVTGGTINGAVSGNGTLVIDGEDVQNNVAVSNAVTINEGKSFTSNADNISGAVSVADNGTYTVTGGAINGAVSGNGTLAVDGDNVQNNASISTAVAINEGKSLTSVADLITGNIVNNGTYNIAGGTLTNNINLGAENAGVVNVQKDLTVGANNLTIASAVTVPSDVSLDVGTNTITLGDTTINGTAKMTLTKISEGDANYEGGKININGNLTLGGYSGLSLTVDPNAMTTKSAKTGLLDLIPVTGTTTGSFKYAETLSNNRYTVTPVWDEATGRYKYQIAYTTTAEDIVNENGGTSNNAATAAAWDTQTFSGFAAEVQSVLNEYSQHDVGKYIDALTNLAPTDSMTMIGVTRDINNILSHQIAGRLGTGKSSGDMFIGRGLWAQGLYNHSKQDKHGGNQGFTGKTAGIGLGFDGKLSSRSVVGLGYAFTHTTVDSFGRDTDVDAHNFFAYGKYQPSKWYVRGMVDYGFAKYKEKATITSGLVNKSDYDVYNFGGNAYIGYDLPNGLTPEFGLLYTYVNRDEYTDKAGQKVETDAMNVVTASLGVNYSANIARKVWSLAPTARAALTYDLASDDSKAKVSIGNTSYEIIGKKLSRFGIEGGIGAELLYKNWEFTADYDIGWRSHYMSHTGTLKVKYNF